MKRFLLLVVAALILGGCSSLVEQDALPTVEVNAPQILYASFEEPGADSRTYVDQDQFLQ